MTAVDRSGLNTLFVIDTNDEVKDYQSITEMNEEILIDNGSSYKGI